LLWENSPGNDLAPQQTQVRLKGPRIFAGLENFALPARRIYPVEPLRLSDGHLEQM